MPQSLCSVYIHLVFSTKERRSLLADFLRDDLHIFLGGLLKARGSLPLEINSVPIHVHLLFSLPRTIALAKLVEDLKTNSSRWIKAQDETLVGFQWQAGYGAFSIGTNQIARVRRYIVDQQTHHLSTNFQDEYLWLLEKHAVPYDENHLWD